MSRRYVPWWRVGVGTTITRQDGPGVPSRATLDITATVAADPGRHATVAARLFGPGEVTGFDPAQVIRTDPAPGTTDFELSRFCAVELRAAELPWMFTPAAANSAGQLRPWLVLVVVERDRASLDLFGDRPRPVLTTDPSSELPDLAQSWAWAHVQVSGDGDATALLRSGDRSATLARLLCPRRLRPLTAYLAAVVPAFAQGVEAGLGLPVDAGDLRPAWQPADTAVELPVYHHWEFATGPAGDFEQLAARLRLHQASADAIAGLPLTIPSQPAGLAAVDPVRIPGALGTGGAAGGAVDPTFATALVALLDVAGGTAHPDLPVALPTYGRWHAGRRAAADVSGTGWLAELNCEPAGRAVAALGTRVVQEKQDRLMASAWAQIGPIERANRLLRQGQLAREAGGGLWRRDVGALSDATLLAVAAPAGSRLLARDGRTVAARVAASRVPPALLTAAARRALRPRGPLGRGHDVGTARAVERANERDGDGGGPQPVGVPPPRPPGMVAADEPGAHFDLANLCALSREWWAALPPTANPVVRAARLVLARQFAGRGPCTPLEPRPPLAIAELADALRTGLDPETAVTIAVLHRLTLPADWSPADPLEPVLAAPEFPAPMYREVADRAPNLLLPGVNDLPPNSVTLVGTNPWFVQAFMVGLNHEMARELLWRGFPTDQRGTCFRRFWDRSGAVPPLSGAALDDVAPIPSWDPAAALGVAGAPEGDADPQLVLVVRGELLRRYPRAVIYVARAAWSGQQDVNGDEVPTLPAATTEEHPIFAGVLPPDVTFLGFDLTPDEARGSATDPGYYLVFAEPPSETRFGLDEEAPTQPTHTWGDLSWDAVTVDAAGHVSLGAIDPAITIDPAADARELHFHAAATSAQIAAVVEQRPYRVAIHARRLLPEAT